MCSSAQYCVLLHKPFSWQDNWFPPEMVFSEVERRGLVSYLVANKFVCNKLRSELVKSSIVNLVNVYRWRAQWWSLVCKIAQIDPQGKVQRRQQSYKCNQEDIVPWQSYTTCSLYHMDKKFGELLILWLKFRGFLIWILIWWFLYKPARLAWNKSCSY